MIFGIATLGIVTCYSVSDEDRERDNERGGIAMELWGRMEKETRERVR